MPKENTFRYFSTALPFAKVVQTSPREDLLLAQKCAHFALRHVLDAPKAVQHWLVVTTR